MTLEPAAAKKWALGLAALVGLATLRVGWIIDDHGFLSVVTGAPWFHAGPWDIYALSPGDPARLRPFIEHGPYPWWTLEALKVHFLRPISSLTIWFDLAHFADAPWVAHLHSVVWWLLAVLAVCALFARVLPGRTAAIAMLLFAIDDTHWVPVGWVANRHVLVSGAAVAFGFWAWLRWRETGARGWQGLALLLFALGLAGGESAISSLALVGAWELWGRSALLRERLLALAPLAALGVAYIAVYRAFGFGTFGSGIYIDPGSQPLIFLARAPGRFLALLAPLTLNIPSDAFVVDVRLAVATSVAGALGLALWLFAFRALGPQLEPEQKRALRWLVPGLALSMVPSLATFPSDRLLFAPSIAGAALLAVLLDAAFRAGGRWTRVGFGLLLLHLVVAAGVWAIEPGGARHLDDHYVRLARETDGLTAEQLNGHVLYVNAPDMLAGVYVPFFRREAGLGVSKSWNLLSAAPLDHRLTRTGAQSFELEVLGGSFLGTTLECLFRNPVEQPFAVGSVVQLDHATVTVSALQSGLPQRLRVDLADPPEAYAFVQWKGGRMSRLALPPPGQSIELVHEAGPIELVSGLGSKN